MKSPEQVMSSALKKWPRASPMCERLIDYLSANMLDIEKAFESAGLTAINTYGLLGRNEGDTPQIWQATAAVINELEYTRTILRSRSRQFTTV
jgi:insecticidal toxin complex protein TccC